MKNINALIDQTMVLVSVNNFVKHLYSISNPEDKNIFICIDGCTSINKMNE